MTYETTQERDALAALLADEAVDDLALDPEDRDLLAAILEIDLLVHPALDGVLETEALQRKQLGPSGVVSKGADVVSLDVANKRR